MPLFCHRCRRRCDESLGDQNGSLLLTVQLEAVWGRDWHAYDMYCDDNKVIVASSKRGLVVINFHLKLVQCFTGKRHSVKLELHFSLSVSAAGFFVLCYFNFSHYTFGSFRYRELSLFDSCMRDSRHLIPLDKCTMFSFLA